jgi:S-adenosyl-L-methionine hydrolase (adenosine-forming)
MVAREIVLYTDFGLADIYVGQLKSVLYRIAPRAAIIDLAHELPPFNVRAAAHLLDALKDTFSEESVFLCVVDPGVGTERGAVVLQADRRWFVGPDNGLVSVVAARAATTRISSIVWRPRDLSDSFHGRDLFAPVAARLAAGTLPPEHLWPLPALATNFGEGDVRGIIYIDHYGNACTGIRASGAPPEGVLAAKGHRITRARVYGEVTAGAPLWHLNSHGLVEIAVNCGSAARVLGLRVGDPVAWTN